MASIFDRISKLARTPQGRRMVQQATSRAQQLAKDPATRAKVERLRSEITKRSGGRRPSSSAPNAAPNSPPNAAPNSPPNPPQN